MPLYIKRRKDNGSLEIRGFVQAAGTKETIRVRQRAGTDDEKLAAEEARLLEARLLRDAYHGERRATKTFADAVISYLKHEPRTEGTKALVQRLLLHFRETSLDKIDQEAIDKACDALLRPGVAPSTKRRNIIVPVRAILTHAARRKWCDMPLFDIPAEPKGRTDFLMPDQVEALIAAAAPHIRPLLTFLICTGCRVSEALGLEWDQVDLRAGRVTLWEGETKSGNRRVAHLPPRAVAALGGLPGRAEHVFRAPHGGAYRQTDAGGGGQLRSAWNTACKGAALPGQTTERKRSDRSNSARWFKPQHTPHCLRHSWASWHYAIHKDLLLLKNEGGWSSVTLVERYAHLLPAGMDAAILAMWGETPGTAAVERA